MGVRTRADNFLRARDDMAARVIEEKRMDVLLCIALNEIPVVGKELAQIGFVQTFSMDDAGIVKQRAA